jgi:hypothetical protein
MKGFFSTGIVAVIISLVFLTFAYSLQSRSILNRGYEIDLQIDTYNQQFIEIEEIVENSMVDALSDASATMFESVINSETGEPYECAQLSLDITNTDRSFWEGCCRNYCIGTTLFSGEYDHTVANDTIELTCDSFATESFQSLNQTLRSYLTNKFDELESLFGAELSFELLVDLPSTCSYAGNDASFSVTVNSNITLNQTFLLQGNSFEFSKTKEFSKTYTVGFYEDSINDPSKIEIVDFVNISVFESGEELFNQPLNVYVTIINSDSCSVTDTYPYDSVYSGSNMCKDS